MSQPHSLTVDTSSVRPWIAISAGHGLYFAFNVAFDGILYVYVVHTYGMLEGGLFMTLLAGIINVVMLLWYQRIKVDWAGGSYVEGLLQKGKHNALERMLLWAHVNNPILVFVLLNILQDPFVTTAYFKKGDFSGLTRRDWTFLVGSILFANFYWTIIAAGIGETVAIIVRSLGWS